MSENPEKHARSRRRGFSSWAGGVDIVAAVGAITGVGLFILAVIGLHDDPLTIALGIVAVVFVLFLLGRQYLPRLMPRVDPERYQAWQVDRLADQIENGPPGVDGPLPRVEEPDRVVEELAERLRENKRLCVILPPLDKIFEVPPGISDDLAPSSHLCQMIVQRISEVLAEAPELGDHGERAAQRLRDAVRHTLPLSDQETMTQLREEVVETLSKLASRSQRFRLVPLADLPQKGALESPAGKWLLDLFSDDLVCTFGLFYKEGNEGALPPTRTDKASARTYASRELSRLLPEDEVDRTRDALRNVAGDDMDLVRAQCAVITAAAEFGEEEGSLKRLQQAGYRERTPKDRKRDCVLAFRWLVGRKTANLAEASSDKPEVFDRCAVTGRVTCEMFTELTRDLVPTEDVAEELFIWLSRAEFRDVGFIEGAADGSWIRLGEKISDAAFDWLKNRAPAAYEDAQVAVERYYRQCLVLNRAQLPALGYEDLVAPGYGGLHLYETPDWWDDFYTWAGHAAVISAPEHREGAGTALVCLFLETWWWWGDQVRLTSVDKVLKLAREVFRDRPGWIAALNEFDRNYVAQLHERAAAAGEQWEHVASALGFISGRLNLRQGEIPDDPVLVRIYICWCFFSGDVAQAGDDLTAADGWFREAARACGDREDDAGMRAFARYQQADVWVPADPQRSLALIRQADLAVPGSQEETDLPGAARALDDLSLLAYVARMYGDIRWESGDTRGAFDAYGRALMLTYVYQVDQESVSLPPSEYTRSLYAEMRTRLARRLDQARTSQHQGEADGAIARIRALFKPYWADAQPPEPPSGGDPLAGIVPPLPDDKVLNTLDSDYAATAKLMLNDKLADEIAKPADAPLAAAAAASPAPAGS